MTYVPKVAQADTPVNQAIEILKAEMGRYGLVGVYEGRNLVHGQDQGAAVVCVVEEKGPRAQASQIPQYILTPSGNRIPTDVVVGEQPKNLKLVLPDFVAESTEYRRCMDAPIPGGAQIAPQGRNWVGTLGAAVKLPQGYGFITNEHVTGEGAVNALMCQPNGNSGWIGKVVYVGGIRYDGPNYIDLGAVVSHRADGPYAGRDGKGTHLVKPQQLSGQKINPSPVIPTVGMRLHKEGRTTGKTSGVVKGVNGVFRVGYDRGAALFEHLVVVEAHSGLFSSQGDSGSLLYDDGGRPAALLFAGGGGQTLACRIDYVLDACGGTFFAA